MSETEYRPARKTWADSIGAAEHHHERARDLLHEAGEKEGSEATHQDGEIISRLLLAARIHAELSTAAACRAQAALL